MRLMMRLIMPAGLMAMASATPSHAESAVQLSSAVFVEHTLATGNRPARLIEPASRLTRGQRVLMVLEWRATGNNKDFTVTTAVPRTLAYEKSGSGLEEISVDHGISWGRLGKVEINDKWGSRIASPQDATHIRWRVDGRAGQGRITYSAFVR